MNDVAQERTTQIKICGLKTVTIAKAVGELQPDFIGFMFARSKREVTPAEAGEMIRAMRQTGSSAKVVGVFVNPTLAQLASVLAEAPLDIVQLHGAETPDYCEEMKSHFPHIAVWKVLSVTESDMENGATELARTIDTYNGAIDAIMLDTQGGGTGKTFRWELIPVVKARAAAAALPLYIAGGLQPDNVGELVTTYAPDGVDVSSGVETNGEKDITKIAAFIERVRAVDRQRT